ncbi:calcium-binding protein [Luteimonas yindakuii]|uniref:Calcium-binding protein n=1 Tax=Luteimonas yindakuii TaxID=2565782 RepID=A0A4Z1R6C3_9GAMM|nr:calcium-binding protein [Luteimonas yindakuii]QCU72313.1 calcium-binding protein [Luteimonas yindakuii]TKS55202.1 calcium-binding protein [Luteimonas yindakuii]
MRRIIAALLLLAVALAADAAPTPITDVDTAADAVIQAAGDRRLIVIGELHGTVEVPALVQALARHYVRGGPVLVALEVHATEHARIRAYLGSDGGDEALHALREGPFWSVSIERNDGRRTRAMLDLIDTARRLHGEGHSIAVVPFDPARSGKAHPSRDRGMATILRAGFEALPDTGRMLVLTGNRHAMRVVPSDSGAAGLDSAAGYLLDLPLHSVNVMGVEWAFQACTSMTEPCGRREGRYAGATPGSRMSDPGDSTRQYDQGLMLPRLTASALLERVEPTRAAAAAR